MSDYCGSCGRTLEHLAFNVKVEECPDCQSGFCSLEHLAEHSELGTCPKHADGAPTPPTEEPRGGIALGDIQIRNSTAVPRAAYERVVAELEAVKAYRDDLSEMLAYEAKQVARLRSDLNQAADLVTTLVRADNNRTGKGPGGRITGADTLPLQQLLGLALTLREPFGNLGPSLSEGNTSA